MGSQIKSGFVFFFCVISIIGCQQQEGTEEPSKQSIGVKENDEQTDEEMDEETERSFQMKIAQIEDKEWIMVDELVNQLDGNYVYDDINRTLTIELNDHRYYLLEEVPVLEHNGEYIPTDQVSFIIKENNIYLSLPFIEHGLGVDYITEENHVVFMWEEEAIPVVGPSSSFLWEQDQWDVDSMSDYLSFLDRPIEDAEVSTLANHLPGAPRTYRHGYHEGIDWYDYATGSLITTETPVYGMAEGVVVRADHDFKEYESVEKRNADLEKAAAVGETPEYILDRLRGKQVWVQYDHGVMNRFAHLDAIPESIQVGERIEENTIVGYVGNSGTSGAVNNDGTEIHLHHDLLIYGRLFWEYLEEDEVVEVLTRIFHSSTNN